MKIAYVADIRLPTEKAHGLQIMETCSALAAAGNEVELFVSSYGSSAEDPIFDHYGIRKSFKISAIPGVGLLRLGQAGFLIRSRVFAVRAGKIFRIRKRIDGGRPAFDAVYTRDEAVVRHVSRLGYKVFYEMHDVRKGRRQLIAIRRAAGVVVITKSLARLCEAAGKDRKKILVAPDGADLDMFNVPESKEECRRRVGLPPDKKLALYSGHLYSWKGADVLAAAAAYFDKDTVAVFVGGTDADISAFKSRYATDATGAANGGISVVGRQPHSSVPYYLKAADALILPNSAKEDISRLFTSPLKLFEYMASGVPIVASDLPSLREIIDERSAFFARPDDPKSLAEAVKAALNDPDEAGLRANAARGIVEAYSWNERGEKISRFIFSVL